MGGEKKRKKKNREARAHREVRDYPGVIGVIDEWRWRSARIPRPIFSGETRRRYRATLSPARIGFPGVCIYDSPISDHWHGRKGRLQGGVRFSRLAMPLHRINERAFVKAEIVLSLIRLIVDSRVRISIDALLHFHSLH